MCYNPLRLLCTKTLYKGVEKTIILFRTMPGEYEQGFAVRNVEDLGYNLGKMCAKYGLIQSSGFVTFTTRIELPCRKCLECTRNRAKEWSVRCQLEAMRYPDNTCFMATFTYNEDNLPKNWYLVYDPSEDAYVRRFNPTLKSSDFSAFMKSLRKPFEREGHTGIRFFCCGEYGARTKRPHYHAILFNLPLDDLQPFGVSKSGFPQFRSPTLEKHWNKGFVTVQPFSIECARYVAQYCCKKLSKNDLLLGREPEFINMSRRPGIGMNWFYNNMEEKIRLIEGVPNDHLFLPQRIDGQVKSIKFKVPGAFTRIFKPVTDSKRGLDTEIPDIAYMLNADEECFIDALSELKEAHAERSENARLKQMAKFGYMPEDRYKPCYLDYLKRIEASELQKFKPKRGMKEVVSYTLV